MTSDAKDFSLSLSLSLSLFLLAVIAQYLANEIPTLDEVILYVNVSLHYTSCGRCF